MNELRRDYILDRWVIIAENRGKRPNDFIQKPRPEKPKVCYFCPGNEHTTPPEIDRIEEGGRWIVRCFPNKFPATIDEFNEEKNGLLRRMPSYGTHEVIAETPNHNESLGDLDVGHIVKVFEMYSRRIKEISIDRNIRYINVFKNYGHRGGASLSHSHTQLIALPLIPKTVMDEINASENYKKNTGNCPFCDIWKLESKGERRIYEDEFTVAFAPFASRFNFEVWIMPKRHLRTLSDMSEKELFSFSTAVKKILHRLDESLRYPPFNFFIHYAPEGHDLHFHLEFAPRLSRFAGLEFGSEIVINAVSPEVAAKHYKEGI